MPEQVITSLQNPRVKDAAKLRDARQRAKQQRIIIDGRREILRAAAAGVRLVELFVCEPLLEATECAELRACATEAGASIFHVSPAIFQKLSFGSRSEGAVATALRPQPTLRDLPTTTNGLVAVLEGVEKPGNVGAVLRSADGAGIDAVIVAGAKTDLYNPNCIRASLGTVFTVPVCQAEPEATWAWLCDQKLAVVAARVDAPRLYTEVDYRQGTAIVLGSEAEGLSGAWTGAAVTGVRLPMLGVADSLNVSATAAVLFYEARRQRDAAGAR